MPKPDPLMRAGHRERLRSKFEDGNTSEAEEMELLLTHVIPRRDVRVLSRKLLEHFGGAYNVIMANPSAIQSVDGSGPAVATFFTLLRTIISRGYKRTLKDGGIFANPNILAEYCRARLAGKTVEELHIMYMDKNGRLLYEELHNIGAVNYSHVYPEKILANALTRGASKIALFHNHPVGEAGCSTPDIEMTVMVGKMLWQYKIEIADHVIVDSRGVVCSMRNAHALDELDNYYINNPHDD